MAPDRPNPRNVPLLSYTVLEGPMKQTWRTRWLNWRSYRRWKREQRRAVVQESQT